MKLALTLPLAALLTIAASACSKPPELVVSHPPIVDLSCPAEPDVVAMLADDPSGLSFDIAVREAGASCRAALLRVCSWHKARGAAVDC